MPMSGNIKVENLSGGVYRSSTPSAIPEISWSDMANWNIKDKSLVTRDGYTRNNSSPFYPGCVKFGVTTTLRTNFLKATGGDFYVADPVKSGPLENSKTVAFAFYAKEKHSTATSAHRTLFSVISKGGTQLMEVYWSTASRLEMSARINSTLAAVVMVQDQSSSDTIPRPSTTCPANIYFASVEYDGTAHGLSDFKLSLKDYKRSITYAFNTVTAPSTSAGYSLILGNDVNVAYPTSNWTNKSNYALSGYMGEFVVGKDGTPWIFSDVWKKIKSAPGSAVATTDRIAYYKLQTNGVDSWGISPPLSGAGFYTGSGLGDYSVEDPILTNSRDVMHITKSWAIDTFKNSSHVYAKTSSLAPRYRNYIKNKYALTFDVLPVRWGASTSDFNIVNGTTSGPMIRIRKVSNGKSRIVYKHTVNTNVKPEITYDIPNNYTNKITCQTKYSSVSNRVQVRIFNNTMLVASTVATLSTTARTPCGNLRLGQSITSTSFKGYMSGLILHNTNAGDTWGARPEEDYEKITTSTRIRRRRRRRGFFSRFSLSNLANVAATGHSLTSGGVMQTIRSSRTENKGNEDGFSLFDLPLYSNVKGLWLLTESSGFDTADATTPHGVISNSRSTSTSDGTNFVLQNNFTPLFVPDRNSVGLVTTGYLDCEYEDECQNSFAYNPVNTVFKNKLFVSRGSQLVDSDGTAYKLADKYQVTQKTCSTMRGFMYGNDLFIHNQDTVLRYNGNEIRGTEVITPSIPLTLTKINGSSGLNGAYKYSYTYVDKNGIESYPVVPTSTTVKLGSIAVALNSKITANAYLNENVQAFRFYRNKGGTTSVSLTRDADKSLYLLKEVPAFAVVNSASTTLFFDKTADTSLGANPPEPDTADPIPKCKFSTLHQDVAVYTGDPTSPNHYYESAWESPAQLGVPGYEEFRTEDGEHNTGVASVGFGYLVFKNNHRKLVRGGMGGESYEYHNGGCMSHDSLVRIGQNVIGLGSNGFFITDGHNYSDITTVNGDGRPVSSIQLDFDTWSDGTKASAKASYHQPTGRYICYVNNLYYIYDTRYRVWLKYDGLVGHPMVYNNDLYIYKKGYLWKETDAQNYIGAYSLANTIVSTSVGSVTVLSTSAYPTSNAYGYPVHVDNTLYWTKMVSSSARITRTKYCVALSTTKDFTGASRIVLGRHKCYADTKYFQCDTPTKKKWFKRLLWNHDDVANGVMTVHAQRNLLTHSETPWFTCLTEFTDKNTTWLRHCCENLSLRFKTHDGKKHTLRDYTMWYEQTRE